MTSIWADYAIDYGKGSDEGKRIHKLFEGCKNYEGLGMFGLGSEGYRNNPIEVDAYELGDKIEKLFSDFIIATSK